MYSASERLAQARALTDQSLRWNKWLDLHHNIEDSIFQLIDGADKHHGWSWPSKLHSDVRSLVVAAHTLCCYQSGGWGIGVIANGLNVLPFVPDALKRVGYLSEAIIAEQSLLRFPEDIDFSEPSGEVQTAALNVIENQSDYNSFLDEIEAGLGSDWDNSGLPERITNFARSLDDVRVWSETL